jgi:hypothetical protein
MTIFCQDNNHREIELLKDESSRELKEVLAVQAELMKRKVCSSVEMQPNATNSKKTTRVNSKTNQNLRRIKLKTLERGIIHLKESYLLIGINILPSEHFLRLPIIKNQVEPIALGIKQAVLLTEKVMHLQKDGYQWRGLQKIKEESL